MPQVGLAPNRAVPRASQFIPGLLNLPLEGEPYVLRGWQMRNGDANSSVGHDGSQTRTTESAYCWKSPRASRSRTTKRMRRMLRRVAPEKVIGVAIITFGAVGVITVGVWVLDLFVNSFIR